MHARLARRIDAPCLAMIYNQGVEDRVATFETRLREAEDVEGWFDGRHPIVVVEQDKRMRKQEEKREGRDDKILVENQAGRIASFSIVLRLFT